MPGIIPMKLIKCGSSQTRIAQACDRCRSKKIRCDGIRPCCSQCANVGFECKTSDKLSRRAFPRGYTESLEERVRTLEAEVRDLKELLDAKDEQLDMLSRIHSFSPYSPPASSSPGGSNRHFKSPEMATSASVESVADEIFTVQETHSLMKNDAAESFYMGSASGIAFVELLKKKLKDGGLRIDEFDTEIFFQTQGSVSSPNPQPWSAINIPPRLLSDQLLVSYFQEYHPLFPVLHRPTFLASYERLVSADGPAVNELPNHAIAQLFLVFAIALQQSEPRNGLDQQLFDSQWQHALNAIIMDSTLETLQCLVLAQLCCFSRGDYPRLLQYKSLAVGIALRLGLNQNQRKFSLGALGGEMRKRAFWCTYCLDSFSASMLGLPKLFKEADVDAEYPSDIDDEYISEKGFLPTLPGDSTKISSALALFRSSRILAKVLENVYSSALSHDQSYNKLKELEEEVDAWKNGLAPHLRLEFVNGSPATNVVHSRSPLLILAYHYIRVLIHRPVVGSILTHRSSASLLTIRDSSKCIIQIVQLLTERKLGFSFCLNKTQLLLLSSFSVIFSALECQQDGSLAKENQKLILATLEELEKGPIAIAKKLREVASLAVNLEASRPVPSSFEVPTDERDHSLSPTSTSPEKQSIRRRLSTMSEKLNLRKDKAGSRKSNSQDMQNVTNARLTSASLTDLSGGNVARSRGAPASINMKTHQSRHSISFDPQSLDFMPWGLDPSSGSMPHPPRPGISNDDWERVLAAMDASHAAHIYGDGGSLTPPITNTAPANARRPVDRHWDLNELPQQHPPFHVNPPSISSYSDEGFASEDGGHSGGDMGIAYPEGDNLGDFLGPMMAPHTSAGGQSGTLLESEWRM
ncbi:DNA-binding transcription factor cat8 [Rhizina undulata]